MTEDRLRLDHFMEIAERRRAEGGRFLTELIPDPDDRAEVLAVLAAILSRTLPSGDGIAATEAVQLAFAWGIWCAQEGAARLLP